MKLFRQRRAKRTGLAGGLDMSLNIDVNQLVTLIQEMQSNPDMESAMMNLRAHTGEEITRERYLAARVIETKNPNPKYIESCNQRIQSFQQVEKLFNLLGL